MLPTIFVSHGSPMLALTDNPARHFLAGLGGLLEERPKAILVASAHWETARPTVNAMAVNETIHDFHGFPPALYRLNYPAPGDPALAERVSDLLCAAGLASEIDHARGLDHGAWVPLLLAWPEHDIPVLQLSVQSHLGPAYHLLLGQALAALRADGVLVIGSGSFTHDLSRLRRDAPGTEESSDVTEFSAWMHAALIERRTGDLLNYRRLAPFAAMEHPTEEHLLPIYVALGAAGEGASVRRLHSSTNYAVLRMDAYAFGG